MIEFAVYPVNLWVNNARTEGHDLIGPFVFPSFRSGKAGTLRPIVTSSEEFREGDKKMDIRRSGSRMNRTLSHPPIPQDCPTRAIRAKSWKFATQSSGYGCALGGVEFRLATVPAGMRCW